MRIARGKPAEFDQEIVKRRFRLTKQFENLSNKTILDFGCGNGAQTVQFADAGAKIIAIDIDKSDLTTLSNYCRENGLKNILTSLYDGQKLPVCSASVDLAVSYEVLEHVENEAQALREIRRVLKPNGKVIFSVPNKGWIFETHGAYLPFLPWNRVPFFSWLPRSIHSRFAKARIYRKKDIQEVFTRNGFKLLRMEYITAPMDVVKNPTLKRFLKNYIFKEDVTPFFFLATAILVHGQRSD